MNFLISTVLERWITQTDAANPLQLLYMVALHSTNAGRRKKYVTFLSNSVSAMESERSNSLKELSQYCENALNAAMDLRGSLPSLVNEGSPLERMCRRISPAYRKFLSLREDAERLPNMDLNDSVNGKGSREEEIKREGEEEGGAKGEREYGEEKRGRIFTATEHWIAYLCDLRASALIKINPLINWKDALSVFEIHNAPPTPSVLVTRSIAYSLGEDYQTGLALAERALHEGHLSE